MITNLKSICMLFRHDVAIYPAIYRLNSTVSESKALTNSVNDAQVLEIDDEAVDEMKSSQNKSRLSIEDYNLLHNRPPSSSTIKPADQSSLIYKRQMFGKYGFESGEDPALCFHTKEEVENVKEYERVAFNKTIHEMRQQELQHLEDKRIKILEREKEMEKQMALQEEWMQRIKEKMNQKLTDAAIEQKKRDKLIRDIRKQLGYSIEPTDPRFLEILEQKEAEARKIKKQEKKKKREEYFLAKIAALEASAEPKSADQTNETTPNDEERSTSAV